jgi:tripartite-type tricarboxylate transporter receptor subunit TctC
VTPRTRPGRDAAAAGLGLAAVAAALPAFAQGAYPTRPVRMVVPSSPGGGTDITGRAIAQKLTEAFRQQFIVDNRAGAGTIIGTDIVAKAAPDGHTLLVCVSPIAINPAIYRKLPYDALRDFAPITQTAAVPNVLTVHPAVPARTVSEFIALARAKPGQFAYASAGVGTSPHLSAELFRSMAGIELVHVPYKGTAPGVVDLIAGQVAAMFVNTLTVAGQLKSGKVRAIAVTTAKRSQMLPDIPTIAESGLSGYEATQWYGVMAPASTPQPIVDRLHREIAAALAQPDVRDRFAADGAEAVGSTPAAFAAYFRDETAKWAKVAKVAGITPQ